MKQATIKWTGRYDFIRTTEDGADTIGKATTVQVAREFPEDHPMTEIADELQEAAYDQVAATTGWEHFELTGEGTEWEESSD